MKLKKVNFVILLLIIASSFISFSKAMEQPEAISPNAAKLVIATRHDYNYYTTMAKAFASSEAGKSVGITNPNDIQFETPTTYEGFKNIMENAIVGADIAWGGGPTIFNRLAEQGVTGVITDAGILGEVDNNISDVISGAQMKKYDANDDLMWVSSAISSFGFTVNKKELTERGLAIPTTWEDLASPNFFTSISEFNIGIGNAPDTTSNTRIYQIILQKYGWEKGWQLIIDIAANSKIYTSSGDTRDSVLGAGGADPETAVSLTIDFYGLRVMNENPYTEYIVPENGSIVNADPIAMDNNPSHPAAATAFMKWVISQEGQSNLLNTLINRLPVRADAFDTPLGQTAAGQSIKGVYTETLAGESILFDEDLALSLEETMRFHFASIIYNVRDKLRSTWSQMVSALNQEAYPLERFDQINEEFGKPGLTMAEAQALEPTILDDAVRLGKMTKWTTDANNKFDNVAEMIDDPFTIATGNTTVTGTVSSITSSVTDVPFQTFWLTFGGIAILTIKYVNRRKKSVD